MARVCGRPGGVAERQVGALRPEPSGREESPPEEQPGAARPWLKVGETRAALGRFWPTASTGRQCEVVLAAETEPRAPNGCLRGATGGPLEPHWSLIGAHCRRP